MAASIQLTVGKVADSVSVASSTSKIKVVLTITTSGETWNAMGDTTGYINVDGKRAVDLAGKKFYKNTTTTLYSGTHTVKHEDDGSKTVTVEASFNTEVSPGVLTDSKELVLDTIPRASVLHIPAFIYGSEGVIGIDALLEGAVSEISYAFGTQSGVLAEKTDAAELAWTPSAELAAEYPHSKSGTGTMTVTTYTGDTLIGSRDYSFTIAADSRLAPQVSRCSVGPTGTDLGEYIKGISQAKFSVSAEGQQGATIAECKLSFGGQTATGSTGQTGLLTSEGEHAPVFTVTDSRGLVTTVRMPKETVYDYYAPSLTLAEVYRCNADGTENDGGECVAVNAQAEFAAVGCKNTLVLRARYRESNAGWGDIYTTLTVDQVNVLTGFSESKSYEVEVSAKDAVGGEKTVVFTIPTAAVAFHIKPGGGGAAFGKYATEDDTLDIAWKNLKLAGKRLLDLTHPIGSFFFSEDPAEPGELFGGTWERIKDVFILAAGETYDAGSTGGAAEHTLTESELPVLEGALYNVASQSSTNIVTGTGVFSVDGSEGHGYAVNETTDADVIRFSAGGGKAHNNMPPYLAAYVWKRIA